jgi:hypothetical protein
LSARLAALVLGVAVALSACGGEPKATHEPTAPTSATPTPPSSPAPTPTLTATPTAEPLSRFEDRAPVEAARAWAVALAKAVNARERSLASIAPLMTAHGMDLAHYIARQDLTHGWLLPGPEPFTPVGLHVSGGVAKVDICLQYSGWSVSRKSGKTVRHRKVVAAVYQLRKVGGTWKFDDYYAGTADCADVEVREVRW